MTLTSPHDDYLTPVRPPPAAVALKRAIDVLGAVVGLALLSPVFVAVAMMIKLDSRGPVFFRQERVGAAQIGTALTAREDKRVTRVGAFLRRSKIDELPQLINVLAGDMSLVGPRPEVPEFMKYYTPEQRAIILSMKPGMTDYAAILFRDESALLDSGRDPVEVYRCEIMPIKFVCYERYSSEIGIVNDLRIILATVILLAVGRLPQWLGLEYELRSLPLLHRSEVRTGG